jgi:hypothetical protein
MKGVSLAGCTPAACGKRFPCVLSDNREPASHNKASFCGESQNAVFEFAKGAIFGGRKATP